MKYQRFTKLGSKDIGIRKSEFVSKTQFLLNRNIFQYFSFRVLFYCNILIQSQLLYWVCKVEIKILNKNIFQMITPILGYLQTIKMTVMWKNIRLYSFLLQKLPCFSSLTLFVNFYSRNHFNRTSFIFPRQGFSKYVLNALNC